MAKPTKTATSNDETAIILNKQESSLAVIDPSVLLSQGFDLEKTIVLGDAAENKHEAFFGEVVGPGPNIEVETPGGMLDADGKKRMSSLPTWRLRPVKANTPGLKPTPGVVVTIIAPSQLHARLSAIHGETPPGKRAVVYMQWEGTTKTRKGNQVNDFTVMKSYLNRIEEGAAQ